MSAFAHRGAGILVVICFGIKLVEDIDELADTAATGPLRTIRLSGC
jgi:hypothetical protein